MYLKPASVVNRVCVALSTYGLRLVRLHFCTETPTRAGLIPVSSFPNSSWMPVEHPPVPALTTGSGAGGPSSSQH